MPRLDGRKLSRMRNEAMIRPGCGPTELGKTLRAYAVEEEANVDMIGRDVRTMARLFGDG